MSDVTLTRRDDLAAVPGAHVWLVERDEKVLGAVAKGEGVWYSARVMPTRSCPWGDMKTAKTRVEAVASLVASCTR
jgi:hypothetical protein